MFYRAIYTAESSFVQEYIGTCSTQKRKQLCLMAHYDPAGRVDEYVIYYLQKLIDAGFDVVLITTSSFLDPADLKKALTLCRKVIHRKNLGFDFCSWKLGLTRTPDYKDYDRLLLVNDSVFGPFRDLHQILDKMDSEQFDLWSLTDNFSISYHLQSYFLCFSKKLLQSADFQEFWRKVYVLSDKWTVIREYEVGLTRFFQTRGYRLGAYISARDFRKHVIRRGVKSEFIDRVDSDDLNMTLFFWDVLGEDFQFPFLKTELLKKNRFNSKKIREWKEIMLRGCSYPSAVVDSYLKRLSSVQ